MHLRVRTLAPSRPAHCTLFFFPPLPPQGPYASRRPTLALRSALLSGRLSRLTYDTTPLSPASSTSSSVFWTTCGQKIEAIMLFLMFGFHVLLQCADVWMQPDPRPAAGPPARPAQPAARKQKPTRGVLLHSR